MGAALEQNSLFEEMLGRLQRDQTPLAARPATNFWLEADVDLRRLNDAMGQRWILPTNAPRIIATVLGDGENVFTRARIDFPAPLSLPLEPWNSADESDSRDAGELHGVARVWA